MKSLGVRFKVWLSTKEIEGVFGDGKWRLLREIDNKGSLIAASKILNISYRKAWGDLKKAEQSLDVSLVDKYRGGRTGGQTVLSKQGKRWIKAYELFHHDIERAVKIAYTKHIKGLVK